MLHKAYPRGYLGKHLETYLDYGIPKDYIGDYLGKNLRIYLGYEIPKTYLGGLHRTC
jgi:hypothetical protein